jgi:hypothetical protein
MVPALASQMATDVETRGRESQKGGNTITMTAEGMEQCRCSNANGPNGEVKCDVWIIEANGLQSELCCRCEAFLPVIRQTTLRYNDVRLSRKSTRTNPSPPIDYESVVKELKVWLVEGEWGTIEHVLEEMDSLITKHTGAKEE